jgi:hypothetical protein
LLLHKATFVVWIASMTLHVIGHLPGVARTLGVGREGVGHPPSPAPGTLGRWIAITSAVVGGLILALALIPDFSTWTAGVHHLFAQRVTR